MNKIFLIVLFAANFLFVHLANAMPYYGVNMGGNFISIKKKLTYPLGEADPASANFKDNYNNFHGQILVGYNFPLPHQFSIAIEGDGDYNAGNTHYKINNWFLNNTANVQEKLNFGYGIYLLPKYHYAHNNVNFFIGPGFSQEKLSVTSHAATGGNIGITGSRDSWLTGFGLKAGVEMILTSHVNLVLTYQYMSFNSEKWSKVEPLSAERLSARYTPTLSSIMAGLSLQ